jgi:hypothetical protein
MKNWLRNKLHNFIFSKEAELKPYADRGMNATISSSRHHGQSLSSDADPLRFTVYNASGGKIVEISHYDSKRDRHETSLHIITSDEDFGESIGRIAFLEVLKKG